MCLSSKGVSIDSMNLCYQASKGDLHVVVGMNLAVHDLAVNGCE